MMPLQLMLIKCTFASFNHTHTQHEVPTKPAPQLSTPAYTRTTGPKTIHAPQTLHFLPPDLYRAEKRQQRSQRLTLMREYKSDEREVAPRVQAKSQLTTPSLQFGRREMRDGGGGKRGGERGRRVSFGNSTTRYHSLVDGIDGGRSQFPRKRASSVEILVLPMNILTSTPVLQTASPVNCNTLTIIHVCRLATTKVLSHS